MTNPCNWWTPCKRAGVPCGCLCIALCRIKGFLFVLDQQYLYCLLWSMFNESILLMVSLGGALFSSFEMLEALEMGTESNEMSLVVRLKWKENIFHWGLKVTCYWHWILGSQEKLSHSLCGRERGQVREEIIWQKWDASTQGAAYVELSACSVLSATCVLGKNA